MADFGQFYNGQYIFGAFIFLFEIIVNRLSGLNMTIFHSFNGDTQLAHGAVNYHWGLFYLSIYAFSIWQTYNKAIIINCQQEGKNPPRETYLTGFCFGLVVGMNVGVYWHQYFFDEIPFFKMLSIPVFNGILLGIIAGFVSHILETYIKKKY